MRGLLLLLICILSNTSFAGISCEDLLFYREQNRKFNEKFNSRTNKKHLAKRLLVTAREPIEGYRYEMRTGESIVLGHSGFQQMTNLVLQHGSKEKTIFSTKDLDELSEYSIASFAVSKNERKVAIALFKKGSIDQFIILVVYIRSGKILKRKIVSTTSDLFWADNNKLVIGTTTDDFNEYKTIYFYTKTNVVRTKENRLALGSAEGWAVVQGDNYPVLINQSGQRYNLDLNRGVYSELTVAGQINDQIIVVDSSQNEIDLFELKKTKNGFLEKKVVFHDPRRIIDEVASIDEVNGFVALSHWGAERWILLFNLQGELVQEVLVPNCCSVESVEWNDEGSRLEVNLTSQFYQWALFEYDLQSKKWTDPRIEDSMMQSFGIQMKTRIVEVQSADGTRIPMRITYRADLERNGKNPVLIEAYGANNSVSYVNPSFNQNMLDFIKRGGILAGPALRGGNEFGLDWVDSAYYDAKKLTMQDLIACEKWFSKSGWSNSKLVITTGASHGGFVVAAAALMEPKALGLTIPIAGVYDIQNLSALHDQHPPEYYPEFGTVETSPVELAKSAKRSPKILLMTGDSDSRVNPQHTWIFARTLLDNPLIRDQVDVVTLKNGGHWMESSSYQSIHSWRSSVVFWTTIYDYLGWSFPSGAKSKQP